MTAEMPADLGLCVRFTPDPVVALLGQLDLLHTTDVATVLDALLDRGHTDLTVDCADLDFIDATGVGVFVAAQRRAAARDGRIRVHGLSETAHRILEITGLVEVLDAEPRADERLIAQLEHIAGDTARRERVSGLLDRLVALIPFMVIGSDGVGVTLRRDGGFIAAAVTDDVVRRLDEGQTVRNDGPCIDAAETAAEIHVPLVEAETRWPEFRRQAEEAGMRSVLSSPLDVDGRAVGSLNLYARHADAFSIAQRARAESVAAFASRLLGEEERSSRRTADRIRAALQQRDVIARAQDILMERHGIDADEAFERLRIESVESGDPFHLRAALVTHEIDAVESDG